MHDLLRVLADALRRHGHTVSEAAALEGQSGTVYTIPLLTETDDGAFLVDVHAEGVLPARRQRELRDICDDVGAEGAVLCHLEAAESTDTGVVLWGRDELVRILGEGALAGIGLDAHAPRLMAPAGRGDAPVAESLSDLLPPAFQHEEPAIGLDGLEDLGFGLFDAEPPRDDYEAADLAPPPTSATAAPDIEPADPDRPAYRMLPMRMTAAEAKARVQERLFRAVSVQMVLQPVHLLDYECDLLAEGSLRYDTVSGRIQVHGTDKTTTEVDPLVVDPGGFTKMHNEELPVEERTLRVTEERARERARTFLVEEHVRLVDVRIDDPEGGFAYTEKKKVAPRPDHVRLHHIGVFHRVLWRVRGPNGHVDVDALTGEAIEERLATPDPGTIILD